MTHSNCLLHSILVFLTVLHFASVASAQEIPKANVDLCADPNVRIDVRPDAEGPPTLVSVGVRLTDLREINDVKQTLTADFGVLLNWTDARLSQLNGCEISLDKVWSPSVSVLNSGSLITSRPREVAIGPGGQVTYFQRYYGSLASHHTLHDFPFDKHKLVITLFPFDSPASKVQLSVNVDFTGRRDLLSISDWTIKSVEARTRSLEPGYKFGKAVSVFDLEIVAHRIASYYLWKVILPLCLIVAMSWCVFWIPPLSSGTQIGLSSTSMLTLIAFIFATSNMVPELGYLTRLDQFIIGSTIIVFLSLLESVLTSNLVSHETKGVVTFSVDRVCRIVFPMAFVTMIFLVFFV